MRSYRQSVECGSTNSNFSPVSKIAFNKINDICKAFQVQNYKERLELLRFESFEELDKKTNITDLKVLESFLLLIRPLKMWNNEKIAEPRRKSVDDGSRSGSLVESRRSLDSLNRVSNFGNKKPEIPGKGTDQLKNWSKTSSLDKAQKASQSNSNRSLEPLLSSEDKNIKTHHNFRERK